MSGIAGWVDYKRDLRAEKDTAVSMSNAIKHRGARAGAFTSPECVLLYRGGDTDAGKQPVRKSIGGEEYTLVFDGTLYNAAELRAELRRTTSGFSGASDAEIVLCAYAEWGSACLDKLNGVFAFAIWQSREKKLFAARDRIGVKPFYFREYAGGILFASEIKSLFMNPLCTAEIDRGGLNQIFLLGPGKPMGGAIYKGISELCYAEYLNFDKNGLKTKKYWQLTAKENHETLDEASAHVRALITDSVERQLNATVPIACFLSGGLDSSIISYIASQKFNRENKVLTTLSVDYEDNDKNFIQSDFQPTRDAEFIACMSAYIASRHENSIMMTDDICDTLGAAALARDLPGMADIDSSMLVACRETKKRFSTCVSGECADEIFGGYPWYHKPEILYNDAFPWSNSLDMRLKLVKQGVIEGDPQAFVRQYYDETVQSADALESDSREAKRMREMFRLNFDWFMQNLLDRTDRMAMQSDLEVRVPLCDYRLVEYAYNLPWALKAAGGREKGIMRHAFRGILPDKIIDRKKCPFPKTFDPRYVAFVKNGVQAVMNDKTSPVREFIDATYLKTLLDSDPYTAAPWYGQLMRLPQVFAYIMQLDTLFKAYAVKIV